LKSKYFVDDFKDSEISDDLMDLDEEIVENLGDELQEKTQNEVSKENERNEFNLER